MRQLALLAAGLFAGTLVAADEKKAAKDEDAIVGTWKIDKFDGGKDLPAPPQEVFDKVRMTFKKDGKMGVVEPDGKEQEGEYKLDAAAKPKTIDLSKDKGKNPAVGIYELDGDTLKLCIMSGTTRPTKFEADGKGTVVMTLKRVKDDKK